MKNNTKTLARRRELLIERCRHQREHMAAKRLAMRQSLGTFQGITRIAAIVRKNPLPLAGLALGLIIVRPRRLLSLAVSAATVWKAWQKLSPTVAPIVKRLLK